MPNSQREWSHKLTPQLHLKRTLPYLYQDVSFQVIFYTLGPVYFVVFFHSSFTLLNVLSLDPRQCYVKDEVSEPSILKSSYTNEDWRVFFPYSWCIWLKCIMTLLSTAYTKCWLSNLQGISHYFIENLCFSTKGIRNSIEPCYSAQFTCRITFWFEIT